MSVYGLRSSPYSQRPLMRPPATVRTLAVVAHPAIEPVTLAEAKDHCRIDFDDEDAGIARRIRASREALELLLDKAFITQTLALTFDRFYPEVDLPRAPLQEVVSVEYIDGEGDNQTVDPSAYSVSGAGGIYRSTLTVGSVPFYPPTVAATPVTVTFDAGFGDAATDVPAVIVEAILEMVAHWYATREFVGASMSPVPGSAVEAAMHHYKPIAWA